MRGLSALIVVTLLVAADRSSADDVFYFTSSPTSWVGHGQTHTLTSAGGAQFTGSRYFSQGAYTNAVSISVSASLVEDWNMEFVGPNLTLPTVGDYEGAARWPFQSANQPGLAWTGEGRGDNALSGNFQVLQADFDSGGNLTAFAANFTQYDEGRPDWWNVGMIRYNSDVPLPDPAALPLLAALFPLALRRRARGPAALPLSRFSN